MRVVDPSGPSARVWRWQPEFEPEEQPAETSQLVRQMIARAFLAFFVVFGLIARNGVSTGQPASQVDIRTAARAEGTVLRVGILVADWAGQWP